MVGYRLIPLHQCESSSFFNFQIPMDLRLVRRKHKLWFDCLEDLESCPKWIKSINEGDSWVFRCMLIRSIELCMDLIKPFKAKFLFYNILLSEPRAKVILLPHTDRRQLSWETVRSSHALCCVLRQDSPILDVGKYVNYLGLRGNCEQTKN